MTLVPKKSNLSVALSIIIIIIFLIAILKKSKNTKANNWWLTIHAVLGRSKYHARFHTDIQNVLFVTSFLCVILVLVTATDRFCHHPSLSRIATVGVYRREWDLFCNPNQPNNPNHFASPSAANIGKFFDSPVQHCKVSPAQDKTHLPAHTYQPSRNGCLTR